MPTPNERIRSAEIEHALLALGASNALARKVAAILAKFDSDIEGMLAAGVAKAINSKSPRESVQSLLAQFAAPAPRGRRLDAEALLARAVAHLYELRAAGHAPQRSATALRSPGTAVISSRESA